MRDLFQRSVVELIYFMDNVRKLLQRNKQFQITTALFLYVFAVNSEAIFEEGN